MVYGIDDFVDQHHKLRTRQGSMVHPAAAVMDQAGACCSGDQALKGCFRTGLCITELGVSGTGCTKKR